VTSSGAQALPPLPSVSDRYRRLANLRDLGGLRLTGGGTVPAGVLYRSDAPYPGDLAPDDFAPDTVLAWPPATVIDLRSAGETAAAYRWPAGVRWHHVPLMREAAVVGADGNAAPSADRLPRSLDALYRRIIEIRPHRLAALLAMTANAAGPVLVHCTAGKDRTGIAVAVLLLAGGVEPADVVADYTATGPNVPALLDRLHALGRTLPGGVQAGSELLGAPADAINIVVGRLTGWPGGAQAWAQAHGAAAEDIRRWRRRLANREA
jgi:rhodanese-related sulfurtransferase